MYDTIPHLLLKILRRKIYPFFFSPQTRKVPVCEQNIDISNDIIYKLLMQDAPCMIARFGAFEMSVISNYLYIKNGNRNIIKYIKGIDGEWWWNEHTLAQMQSNAGFWPPTHDNAIKFAELSIEDAKLVDVLGSWLAGENLLKEQLRNSQKVQLFNLEPFFAKRPWTKALEGKRVLVIHPFDETIKKQYLNRRFLFENNDILPEFELLTYRSVQSIGGNDKFRDWFHALEHMKSDIDSIDFDIAIIGCGAYGLSLAAHIKRSGRKAFHLGGVTQILFGIIGSRWERKEKYAQLFNDYWCKPSNTETPVTARKVENACYW